MGLLPIFGTPGRGVVFDLIILKQLVTFCQESLYGNRISQKPKNQKTKFFFKIMGNHEARHLLPLVSSSGAMFIRITRQNSWSLAPASCVCSIATPPGPRSVTASAKYASQRRACCEAITTTGPCGALSTA